MDSKKFLESDYLDILFHGRNKAYGGYQLRKSYPARIRRAGMFLAAIALASFTYTVWADKMEGKRVGTLALPVVDTTVFTSVPPPEKPQPLPKVEEPSAAAKVKTQEFNTLRIEDDNKVDKPVATQAELEKATVGKLTVDADSFGDESPDFSDPNGKRNGGGGLAKVEGGGGKPHVEKPIVDFVDQPAEFPGGEKAMYAFLNDHMEYPAKAYAASKQGQVRVKFVVDEDGTISLVQAVRGFGFGSEEEAVRVVKSMPKWKPGKLNGVAVKSWFFLPVTFKMEG
jgi:protein TonB